MAVVGLLAAGCAGADGDSDGGAGGAGTTTVSTTESVSSTASTVASSVSTGTGGPCAQDCTAIEVPLCYESVCNAVSHNCEIKKATDDTPCEDGLYCTVDDKCQDGLCKAGGPRECTGDGGADPCLTSVCDEDGQSCEAAPAPNGTSCTSTAVCEANAICQNGVCLGAPKDCSATPLPDDCHVAGCDPVTGDCILENTPDGIPCIQGDACASDKQCQAGVCTGTPIAGCTICSEVEVDNDIASANDDASCPIWQGNLNTQGDHDYYAVHVTVPGSRIDAEVNDVTGAGSCPPNLEAQIILYDAAGTQLAEADFNGVGNCGHLNASSTGATNLPVGEYYVEVLYFDDFGTDPSPYLLSLAVLPPGCGNDVIESSEQCDGTNLNGQDCVSQGFGSGTLSCDASCVIDTSGCAPPFCGDGLVQPNEDCEGTDPGLNTCLSAGFGPGTLGCTPATCTFITTGCAAPACGDGFVQTGEECDDGNNASVTDGCGAGCLIVPACAAGQTRVSVASSTVPRSILDNTSFTDAIHIANVGNIQSLFVMVDITHTFDGDIDLHLTPPTGTFFDVSTANGSSDDNYESTIFGTSATTSITAGAGPFTGLWLPEQSFAPLVGTSVTGDWVLTVGDHAGGDQGTLNQWRVVACVQ